MSHARSQLKSPSLELSVNGESRVMPQDITVAELIDQLGFASRKIAVAVNREVVPRSRFGTRPLRSGDRVEILEAVGGG